MSKITPAQLASYVADELQSGSETQLIARKLASYLLENRQTRELTKVVRAIEAELNSRGTTQVSITSAHAVSEDVKKELAALLEVKNPVFSEVIDTSVVGGVMAQSGERQIDLTVRSKLNQFKVEVMRSN